MHNSGAGTWFFLAQTQTIAAMTEITFSYLSHARILVVEDEVAIRRFVDKTMISYGAKVFEAGSLSEAREQNLLWKPDLIVLDLGLPDGDGKELIKDVRASGSKTPIIVLSARTHEAEKVEALIAGADDYLTKPFGTAELLARVETALRRSTLASLEAPEQTVFKLGDVEVDVANRVFKKAGKDEHLTKIEWRLLSVMLSHRGKLLTHQKLLSDVWGVGASEHTHYLRIYIQRLRNKIEPEPIQPRYIVTEIGIGYRLVEDEAE